VSRERTVDLAAAAGLDLPPERVEAVTEALDHLLALAAQLDELPLDGVEPLQGAPEWD